MQRAGKGRRGVQRGTEHAGGERGRRGRARTNAARCHAAMSTSSLAAGCQRSTLSPVRLAARIACSIAAAVACGHIRELQHECTVQVTGWNRMVSPLKMRVVLQPRMHVVTARRRSPRGFSRGAASCRGRRAARASLLAAARPRRPRCAHRRHARRAAWHRLR